MADVLPLADEDVAIMSADVRWERSEPLMVRALARIERDRERIKELETWLAVALELPRVSERWPGAFEQNLAAFARERQALLDEHEFLRVEHDGMALAEYLAETRRLVAAVEAARRGEK